MESESLSCEILVAQALSLYELGIVQRQCLRRDLTKALFLYFFLDRAGNAPRVDIALASWNEVAGTQSSYIHTDSTT